MFTCLFIRSCYVNPADKSPQLQLMFKSHMRMVSKCDVSDFDSAMFLVPDMLVWNCWSPGISTHISLQSWLAEKTTSSTEQQFCWRKHLAVERSEEDGRTGWSWQKCHSSSRSNLFIYNYGEQNSIPELNSMWNLEADGLQQQENTSGSTPVCQEEKS